MQQKIILEIKTPRTDEITPESMMQFLTSLTSIKPSGSLFTPDQPIISLELAVVEQIIHFFLTIPLSYQSFVESQLLSQYPKALITTLKEDYLSNYTQNQAGLTYGQMELTSNHLYPLKSFRDFKEVDPMSSVLGMLAKIEQGDFALIQILLVPTNPKWQAKGQKYIEVKGEVKNEAGEVSDPLKLKTYGKQVGDKVFYPGFRVGIRILTKSANHSLASLISATFISFNNVTGNSLKFVKPGFLQNKFLPAIINRTSDYIPSGQILNTQEIATFYHFPGVKLATIRNLTWSQTIISDAPENLPIADGLSEEQKKEVNFFARTEFKNKSTTFGIKKVDRRRHIYLIGKTGTGKSTLIANMAINDIRNGEGLCVIDPHGDLTEHIMDYIPSHRVNDIVYLNPADLDHPFHLNPLEVANGQEKELVASGIVSIFNKLYGHSWGPRLEYVLRNTLLTLLEVPNSTLLMVPEILTNPKFRKRVIEKLQDPTLKSFWVNEFEAAPDKLREEMIAPILNKVGQFVQSPRIRGIIGAPKSTVDLANIMNEGKVVILNLSQGKIGEDNSALLGAMIITKLQLAAMSRVGIPEEERRDFFLYVDEFQNFATTSFIKILSEARKYRLSLVLANQYIAQIQEDIRAAIFGNAGTIMTFLVGAGDAPILQKEFGERFKTDDLLALANYQLLLKMMIDNMTSHPFFAQSLPLPQSRNQNREKIIKVSQERYSKKYEDKGYEVDDFVIDVDKGTGDRVQGTEEKKTDSNDYRKDKKPDFKKDDKKHHQENQEKHHPHFKAPTLNSREILRRTVR